MKNLLIIFLLTISTAALAQTSKVGPARTRITDDGKTLTIQIDRPDDTKPVHYQQTFSIDDMNRIQKEWLKYRVFADQGVALPLHEMVGLGIGMAGLLAFLGAFPIVGYYTLRSRQTRQQIH